MNKIWPKFFLLAVLSFIPILSQAQGCAPDGIYAQGAPVITPFPGGWKVVIKFSMTLVVPTCTVVPMEFSGTDPAARDNYSQNGVSVNIRDTKIRLGNSLRCHISGNDSFPFHFFNCTPPVPADVFVEYTLTGKSTTTNPNIRLFPALIAAVNTANNHWTGSASPGVNVPASTAPPAPPAPTCKRATMTRATWR